MELSKILKNMRLSTSILFLLNSVFLFSGIDVFAKNKMGYQVKTIVIDAGHGGKDGATHGVMSKEKDVALAVALELKENIEENIRGVKVILTRTEDVFVPLYQRIDIANRAKADLFISIHCNSMPYKQSRKIIGYKKGRHGRKKPIYETTTSQNIQSEGVETFVSGFGRLDEQDVSIQENASVLLEDNYKDNYEGFDPNDPESYIVLSLVKNSFREQSVKFASLLQDEYATVDRYDRGVKEKSLAVLARAAMPAVLTEIGFISNPYEEEYMNSDEGRKEIAECIAKAIQRYKKEIEQ